MILALAKGLLKESPTILMRFADEMAGSTATAARVVGRSAKSLNQEPSPERVSTESIEPFEKDSILNDAQAYINRGMEKAARDQHLAAIADYDRAIRLKPNEAVAFVNRGVAKYRLRLYRAAVADFDTAIRLSPDNPYAYYSRGVVKYRLSRRRGARQDFQAASRLASRTGDESLKIRIDQVIRDYY